MRRKTAKQVNRFARLTHKGRRPLKRLFHGRSHRERRKMLAGIRAGIMLMESRAEQMRTTLEAREEQRLVAEVMARKQDRG